VLVQRPQQLQMQLHSQSRLQRRLALLQRTQLHWRLGWTAMSADLLAAPAAPRLLRCA